MGAQLRGDFRLGDAHAAIDLQRAEAEIEQDGIAVVLA